jgi:tRNA (adenine37-N6)-methyltransferase
MDFLLHPIGIIHSPFKEKSKTPIQSSRSFAKGSIEVFPEYVDGLQDLEGFSHIHLLYAFHESVGYSLLVTPFLDVHPHGVFATRYPERPNQLGMSIVRLIDRRGGLLDIEGVDMLEGTPLLDIKPYFPEFDTRTGTVNGWYDTRTNDPYRGDCNE